MIDFHFDERSGHRVVGSLSEVQGKIVQEVATRVARAYSLWTKPRNELTSAVLKLKTQMLSYMDLAAQAYHLTGEHAVRFAFAHKMVEQICFGYYKTNQELFSVGNLTTQMTLYNWIIDDATIKAHLVNSEKIATPGDIQAVRPGLILAASKVPQRIKQRQSKWLT